jgi:hypothetical protein
MAVINLASFNVIFATTVQTKISLPQTLLVIQNVGQKRLESTFNKLMQ